MLGRPGPPGKPQTRTPKCSPSPSFSKTSVQDTLCHPRAHRQTVASSLAPRVLALKPQPVSVSGLCAAWSQVQA